MQQLMTLQGTMFLLIFIGWFLIKHNIITKQGQASLTDLVIYLVLPCNIIKSFLIDFSGDILSQCIDILILSIFIQIFCVIFGKIVYRRHQPDRRKCLQYAIICSNAGFLGNPIAEGVFGSAGLLLASIYLIPQRIMMWSSGLTIFANEENETKINAKTAALSVKRTHRMQVFKKVITHPCIIACFIGLLLMLTQWELPAVIGTTLSHLGGCNTALSMLVIGMILAEGDLKNIFDKDILVYSLFRMALIPGLLLIVCRLIRLPSLTTGVSVLLAAMPAGATTSILAAKYNRAPEFAAQLVVISTLISFATSFGWAVVLVSMCL